MDISDEQLDDLYRAGFGVALRLLGDVGDAEDCAQEATARALARWTRVSDYAGPWVVRVSANLAIGMLRKRRRTVIGLDDEAHPTRAAGPIDRGDPEALVARIDLRDELLGLPVRQRQVLVLRYLADLSEEEASKVMGIRVGSVKTHARRGLSRLRADLGDGGHR